MSVNSPPVGPTFAPTIIEPTRLAACTDGPSETGSATGICSGSAPSTSISAIAAPISTVSPSLTNNPTIVPSRGAGTSIFTLSVTTSTSGSYRRIVSPGDTNHFPMTASVTDSPTCGISIVNFAIY